MDIKEFIEQAERLTKAAKSLALRAKYETMLRESFIYDMFISDINTKGIDCASSLEISPYNIIFNHLQIGYNRPYLPTPTIVPSLDFPVYFYLLAVRFLDYC